METDKLTRFNSIIRKNQEEWESVTDCFGMPRSQIMIVWTLCCLGRPCTQKEVCDDWYENKQTINSAAKKLIEAGYIDIAQSPDNFREKLLIFTEKGKFFAMRTVEKMLAAEKNAFDRLSKEEQNELIRISEKHYEFIKEEFEKIKGEAK